MSTTYKTQVIENANIDTLMSPVITNGTIIMQNGTISNVSDPTSLTDAATKNYVINSRVTPNGPDGSIQFNDNTLFNGTSSFTYDNSTGTLYTDIITNGTASFSGGTIDGLSDPTGPIDAATKNYVDHSTNLNESTIILNTSFIYSAGQMINGIIYRDPITESTSNTRFDTTASAISIINGFSNNSIGNSATFYLKNITSNKNAYIYLKPGIGVVFNRTSPSSNGVTVPHNYVLKAKLVILSSTTVLMYIESINNGGNQSDINYRYLNTTMQLIPYNLRALIAKSFVNSVALFNNYYDDMELGSTGAGPLSWLSIIYGQAHRLNLTQDIVNYFPEPASFFFSINKNTSFGSLTGYYRFIYRNGDPTYSITLSGSSGWILDPNGNFVIGPKKSALLWFYLNEDSGTITVYMIGKMNLVT
jgi:hypothetical protein